MKKQQDIKSDFWKELFIEPIYRWDNPLCNEQRYMEVFSRFMNTESMQKLGLDLNSKLDEILEKVQSNERHAFYVNNGAVEMSEVKNEIIKGIASVAYNHINMNFDSFTWSISRAVMAQSTHSSLKKLMADRINDTNLKNMVEGKVAILEGLRDKHDACRMGGEQLSIMYNNCH
jgi:hypothetical protein